MNFAPEELLRIFLAVVVGGIIGLERQYRDKAAGLRTLIFICMGSTVFTLLSQHLSTNGDPGRVAAQIVSGVGFLGAGVIIRENGRLVGITTAATVWFVAALGMGLGVGEYFLVGVSVILSLVVLMVFPRLDQWLNARHLERTYEVTCSLDLAVIDSLDKLVRGCGVKVFYYHRVKVNDNALCTWATSGLNTAHDKLIEGLFSNPDVKAFKY